MTDASTEPVDARIVAIGGDDLRTVLSVEVAERDASSVAAADESKSAAAPGGGAVAAPPVVTASAAR